MDGLAVVMGMGMDVELTGEEADFQTWVRLVKQALQLGRMVAPHSVVEARSRAWWQEYAFPRSQLEMRGPRSSKTCRHAAPAVASAMVATPAIPAQGGVEFAQLAVPERFALPLSIWLKQQWYEVREGDSLTPSFRTLTIWRRWEYMVIEEEEAAG